MAEQDPFDERTGRRSLLDDWRAEVGDDEVARIAQETRHAAEAGLMPSFTDREGLLAHWRNLARRPG